MLANGAFLLGLTLGLAPAVDRLVTALPFEHAKANFVRAARHGLDAMLLWPSESAPSPRPVRAGDLIGQLIPIARRGLIAHGVDAEEANRLLRLLGARASCRMTGARWQRRALAELEAGLPRRRALAEMLERYVGCARSGSPVHCWPIDA